MVAEAIFSYVEALQGSEPWGSVLDAGTGRHSLRWIAGLPSERWTAVTCGEQWGAKLREEFAPAMRPGDRVVTGNWTDAAFLFGERFDVVLADYLLGAVDRFSPYYQDRLFARLRPHVAKRFYVVGLEPYPARAEGPGSEAILEIARLRDACILLAGNRCYREYPLEWTLRRLERSGFRVDDARIFPIIYGRDFIEGQLAVCRGKLPRFADRGLARHMERAIDALRERALALNELHGGLRLGTDYVVSAQPVG
jgi:hypothetical protein